MATARWQLQKAKNKLSEVVRKAREEGPQVITLHGEDAVVVISKDQYREISRPKTTLLDFFSGSPLAGFDLDLERSRDLGRKVKL